MRRCSAEAAGCEPGMPRASGAVAVVDHREVVDDTRGGQVPAGDRAVDPGDALTARTRRPGRNRCRA